MTQSLSTVQSGTLISVNPNNPEHQFIIDDLTSVCADPVHPDYMQRKGETHDIREQFIENRFGGNKQAFVMLRERTAEDEGTANKLYTVDSSLYVYSQETAVSDERDLMGNGHEILTTATDDIQCNPTALIFYSIGGEFKGSSRGIGGKTIRSALKEFGQSKDVALSTLSPYRTMTKWLRDQGYNNNDLATLRENPEELKRLGLKYAFQLADPTETFHLYMGAYMGDMNMNANVEGSKDYDQGMGIMMNWVYPTDAAERERNSKLYKEGKIVCAAHFWESLQDLGGSKICDIPHTKPNAPWVAKPAMF